MNNVNDKTMLKKIGARILAEANDLKRTPQAIANELEMDFEAVQSIINGESGPAEANELISKMADKYPISISNLWLEADDTHNGVIVMKNKQSISSSRIFDRKNKENQKTPYYEYRDTAMSKLAPFKPEWIQPLRIVQDDDAYNPDVTFNNGHLLHQQTFFIGEVNFYWEVSGKKYCAEMNTGDSNYITPFVPHSFTSRNPDELGLIIAVTYAGGVKNALNDFSDVGNDINSISGDLRNPNDAFASKLERYLAMGSLTQDDLREYLLKNNIDSSRVDLLLNKQALPEDKELECIAGFLCVKKSDLMTTTLDDKEQVVVLKSSESHSRYFPSKESPAYLLKDLSRTRHQSNLKGFDLTVLNYDKEEDGVLKHHLHEYIYNYGDTDVKIVWGEGYSEVLEPGDSAYIKPLVSHKFMQVNDQEGHLAIVRVPGALNDSVLDEYAAFEPKGRDRVIKETKQWF